MSEGLQPIDERPGRWAGPLSLLLLAVVLAAQAPRAVGAATSQATMNYGEPFVVYAASHPRTWFGSLRKPPYLVTDYPPVYLEATAAVGHIVGGPPYRAGRLVSEASYLVAVLFVVLLGAGVAGPWGPVAGPLAGALFAMSPFAGWGFLARVDMLGVALSLAALWVVLRRRPRTGWPVLAGLLCAAAVGTKQTFLAAPAAIALDLALERRGGDLARFLGTALAAGAALAAWLFAVYGIGPVWRDLVVYNENPFSVGRMLTQVGTYLGAHALVTGLAAAALMTLPWRRAGPFRLVALYGLLAALVSLSVGKIGSAHNYFLEDEAAAPILAVALLGGPLPSAAALRRGARAAILGVLCLQLFSFPRPRAGTDEAWRAVLTDLRNVPGPLLSTDAGFNLALGKPIPYQPFIMKQLIVTGRVPSDPLLAPLSRGAFPRVVVSRFLGPNHILWTSRQRALFAACYRVLSVYPGYKVLRPAPGSGACSAARAQLAGGGAALSRPGGRVHS